MVENFVSNLAEIFGFPAQILADIIRVLKLVVLFLFLGFFCIIGLAANAILSFQSKPDMTQFTSPYTTVDFGHLNRFSVVTTNDPDLREPCGHPIDIPSNLNVMHAASEVQIAYAEAMYSVSALRHTITGLKMQRVYRDTDDSVCNMRDTLWDIQVPAPVFSVYQLNNLNHDGTVSGYPNPTKWSYSAIGGLCTAEYCGTNEGLDGGLITIRSLSSNEFWIKTAHLNGIQDDKAVVEAATFYRKAFQNYVIHATKNILNWGTVDAVCNGIPCMIEE